MRVNFCLEAVEEALARRGKPAIFYTDQGSQFTSAAFTDLLLKNGIAISVNGRGTGSFISRNDFDRWLGVVNYRYGQHPALLNPRSVAWLAHKRR
jgi:hypothetical protein